MASSSKTVRFAPSFVDNDVILTVNRNEQCVAATFPMDRVESGRFPTKAVRRRIWVEDHPEQLQVIRVNHTNFNLPCWVPRPNQPF